MTSKTKKPAVDIVVDLAWIEDGVDVYAAFADAKINKTLTPTEKIAASVVDAEDDAALVALVERMHKDDLETIKAITQMKQKEEKPNIFVRFWNWITGK